MVGTEMKISKQTEISGLAEFAFFETVLYISCTSFMLFFVIKLVVFVLPYIMSNITLILKRQKVLFLVFSGYARRKPFVILFGVNWFTFPRWKR